MSKIPEPTAEAVTDTDEIDANLETNPDDYLESDEEDETFVNQTDEHSASVQVDAHPVTSQPAHQIS